MLTPFRRCSTQQLVLSARMCAMFACVCMCVSLLFFFFFRSLSFSRLLAVRTVTCNYQTHTHAHTGFHNSTASSSASFVHLSVIYLFMIHLDFVLFFVLFLIVLFFNFILFLFFCNMPTVKCVSFRLIATLDCFVSFRLVWFCYLIFFSRCIAVNRYTCTLLFYSMQIDRLV